MKLVLLRNIIICITCILYCNALPGQQDSLFSKVQVIHADLFRFERIGPKEIQYLSKDVLVRHKSTYLLCDSAVIEGNKVIALGHVRIVEGDSLQIFSDSLYYDGDLRLANLNRKVVLKHKDQQLFTDILEYDLKTRVAHYNSGGLLLSEDAKLKSRRAYYFAETGDTYFKDSVIVLMKEGMNLYSDTLLYKTRISTVEFKGPTLIEQDSLQIFCDEGYYKIEEQKSYFGNYPKYKKGAQIAEAKDIYYESKQNRITLVKNAHIKDDSQEATADSIVIDDLTGEVLLFNNAHYVEGERELKGEQISYNRKTKSLQVIGNPRVLESGREIVSQLIKYDGHSDLGIAIGNVVVSDTTEGYSIVCDTFYYGKKEKSFKAVGVNHRAYIANAFEEDSLYLAADHLESKQLITKEDSIQTMKARGTVLIWSKTLSARCDSLYYTTLDSSFHLFGQPVMWSDSAQLSGDTIRLQLANKKLNDVFLSPPAFIINRDHEYLNNQVKGKEIIGHFEESRIRHMTVDGNAESVYFLKDDDKGYIGTNFIQCSNMKLFFNEEKKVDYIDFFTKPKGVILTLAEGRNKFLEGYFPRYDEQPMSLEEIIQWQE